MFKYGVCPALYFPVFSQNSVFGHFTQCIQYDKEISESLNERLIKHFMWIYRWKVDGNCNSKQKWNSSKCLYKCEKPMNHRVCKEGYSSNPSICVLVIMITL